MGHTASSHGILCDEEFDWTQRREEGEEVQHADEDDRLSCNLSQVSLGSVGDDVVGQVSASCFGPPARGGSKANAAVKDSGPLMRVASSGAAINKEGSSSSAAAASLARAMQT